MSDGFHEEQLVELYIFNLKVWVKLEEVSARNKQLATYYGI